MSLCSKIKSLSLLYGERSSIIVSAFHNGIRTFSSPTGMQKMSKAEFVHPLSQLVLEHLLQERGEWFEKNGLDNGLTFLKDGTFLIKFPSYKDDMSSIWTSYDNRDKKHWLTVRRGKLIGRYMLQDNLKPAWNDSKSTPEKIAFAVDSMIVKIDEAANLPSEET